MQTPCSIRFARVFALCAILLVAGCAAPPVKQPQQGPPPPSPLAAALQAGDFQQAASILSDQAHKAQPPKRFRLLLRAADLQIDGNNIAAAQGIVAKLPKTMPAQETLHRRIILARIQLANGNPQDAEQLIASTEQPPEALEEQWLALAALTYESEGRLLESAKARSQLEGVLPSPVLQQQNRNRLWQALNQAPMDALRARMPPAPDTFGGWLELAFMVREYHLNAPKVIDEITQWQNRYPNHPAEQTLVPKLLAQYREQQQRPDKLALLLPLSGKLAQAGRAIRDGFLAAYYASAQPRPTLDIIDVGSQGTDPLSAYRQAVNDGAQFVVGPLTKTSLERLAGRSDFPAPVLALNTLPDSSPLTGKIYQFGLRPEDEATAAADYAIQKGYRNALVLVPEDHWGQRVSEAFSKAFSAKNGIVLETDTYNPGGNDFSGPIKSMLRLDQSEDRYHRLRRLIHRNMDFEPRRRKDVDVIFIGAFPRQARLIRPQLRFFHAIDVPVIANSDAYTGTSDPAADQDLDGLYTMDIPWILDPTDGPTSRQHLEPFWSTVVDRDPRLVALGIDAYRLIPDLRTLQTNPQQTLNGSTGVLSVDTSGFVHRALLPGRFQGGEIGLAEKLATVYGIQ